MSVVCGCGWGFVLVVKYRLLIIQDIYRGKRCYQPRPRTLVNWRTQSYEEGGGYILRPSSDYFSHHMAPLFLPSTLYEKSETQVPPGKIWYVLEVVI